jgi:hypothetical protein
MHFARTSISVFVRLSKALDAELLDYIMAFILMLLFWFPSSDICARCLMSVKVRNTQCASNSRDWRPFEAIDSQTTRKQETKKKGKTLKSNSRPIIQRFLHKKGLHILYSSSILLHILETTTCTQWTEIITTGKVSFVPTKKHALSDYRIFWE